MDAEIDTAHANQEREAERDRQHVGPGATLSDHRREERTESQIHDGGEHRVTAREARGDDRRERRHHGRSRASVEVLQQRAERKTAERGDYEEHDRAPPQEEREVARHRENRKREHGGATEGTHVVGGIDEPVGTDGTRRIIRTTEQPEHSVVDGLALAFPDHVGDLDEGPDAEDDTEREEQDGGFLGANQPNVAVTRPTRPA